MPSIQPVFIETTAQIKRLCGDSLTKRTLETYLGTMPNVGTSSTVYLEFLRTVIWAYDVVRRTVAESESDYDALIRLSDIDIWIAEKVTARSERRVKLLLRVTSALKENFREHKVTCGEVVTFLDGRMQSLANRRFFEYGIGKSKRDIRHEGGYVDRTQCHVATFPIDTTWHGIFCNKASRKCQIINLLMSEKESIEKVRQAFDSCEDDRKDIKALAVLTEISMRTVSRTDSAALGQEKCWRIGDTIIALECPIESHLLTIDKHFSIICPALGKGILSLNDVLQGDQDSR